MLDKWKRYRNLANGEMRLPDRTQIAVGIAALIALIVISVLFEVTEHEKVAFVIGAATMFCGSWWTKRAAANRALERQVWEDTLRRGEK